MTELSRRRLLALLAAGAAAAAAGGLAGCTGGTSAGEPAADPDEPVRADVAEAEQRLIERYDATLADHPDLAGLLTTLRDQHAAHLAAVLAGGSSGSGGAAAAGTPAAADRTGVATTGRPRVPAEPQRAVAALADAERQAARARTRSCGRAGNAGLARLLALVAASEASHAAVLATRSAG